MKQAENTVVISGIVKNVEIEEKVAQTTGKEFVTGTIKIKSKVDIDGVDKILEIPISLFANKLTNKNNPNPAYDAITSLKDIKTLAMCDTKKGETPDRVCFETASLRMNEFYSKDGKLVSRPVVSGTFHKVNNADHIDDEASFTSVIVVANISEEINKEGDPTGRLLVQGVLPQYGDKADMVPFVVENKEAISHISSHWHKGDTVRIAGIVNFASKVEETLVEMGFGNPQEKRKTIYTTELLITAGSDGALDDEVSYSAQDIREALDKRNVYLASLKEKSSTPKTSAQDYGF